MEVAGPEVDRVAGLEVHQLEQERAHDADVTGMDRREPHREGALADECASGTTARRECGVDHARTLWGGHRHERAKRRGEAACVGRCAQGRERRLELGHRERVEEAERLLDAAKAGERLERSERAEELGLVRTVLVVAVRSVDRDAARIFVVEPRVRLLERRVRLKRERRGPSSRTTTSPSSRWGARPTTSSSDARTPSRATNDGATGCAPIHSSASGPLLGGRPVSDAMAVREPHAYGMTVHESGSTGSILERVDSSRDLLCAIRSLRPRSSSVRDEIEARREPAMQTRLRAIEDGTSCLDICSVRATVPRKWGARGSSSTRNAGDASRRW